MKLKMQHQIGPSPCFWWTERLLKFKTQTALDRIINLTVQQDSIKDGVLILQWVCFSTKKKKDSPLGVTALGIQLLLIFVGHDSWSNSYLKLIKDVFQSAYISANGSATELQPLLARPN